MLLGQHQLETWQSTISSSSVHLVILAATSVKHLEMIKCAECWLRAAALGGSRYDR